MQFKFFLDKLFKYNRCIIKIIFLLLFFYTIIISGCSIADSNTILSPDFPYSDSMKFSNNQITIFNNKTSPPLYIKFKVDPQIENVPKTIKKNINSNSGYTKLVSRPSFESWFQVIVYNENTNEELLNDGFGKMNSIDDSTRNIPPILKNGPYKIILSGNKVNVDISISGKIQHNDEKILSNPFEIDDLNNYTIFGGIGILIIILLFFFGFESHSSSGASSSYSTRSLSSNDFLENKKINQKQTLGGNE